MQQMSPHCLMWGVAHIPEDFRAEGGNDDVTDGPGFVFRIALLAIPTSFVATGPKEGG